MSKKYSDPARRKKDGRNDRPVYTECTRFFDERSGRAERLPPCVVECYGTTGVEGVEPV